jgi:hypothetical protein
MTDSVRRRLVDAKSSAMAQPGLRWLPWAKRRLMRRSEGEASLLERFARQNGRPLDLTNPQTFNEKLYCRMVRWNRRMDPLFTDLADKFAVRPYVSRKVGEQHLVPLLWHGTDPRRIPFDRLTPAYVIKTNHGCRYVIVVTGAPDPEDVIRGATTWLRHNYYWSFREYQYYHIRPRVIIEKHIANEAGAGSFVYRFWCFHGRPHIVSVGNYERSMAVCYDLEWNQLELRHHKRVVARPALEEPKNFDRMIEVASRLSEDFDFVRVDLFNVDGRVYFNELTFTPGAGEYQFTPAEWDLELGRLWSMRD